MRVILFLLLILSAYATCPETSEEAFIDTVEVRKSLLDCTFDQLVTHN